MQLPLSLVCEQGVHAVEGGQLSWHIVIIIIIENNNIIGWVCIDTGAVVSPGGCMWVHLHPIHVPVHPSYA